MINTKLLAGSIINPTTGRTEIILTNTDGDVVAVFSSDLSFYIITGHKTIESYNDWQEDQPVKFLLWNREH